MMCLEPKTDLGKALVLPVACEGMDEDSVCTNGADLSSLECIFKVVSRAFCTVGCRRNRVQRGKAVTTTVASKVSS